MCPSQIPLGKTVLTRVLGKKWFLWWSNVVYNRDVQGEYNFCFFHVTLLFQFVPGQSHSLQKQEQGKYQSVVQYIVEVQFGGQIYNFPLLWCLPISLLIVILYTVYMSNRLVKLPGKSLLVILAKQQKLFARFSHRNAEAHSRIAKIRKTSAQSDPIEMRCVVKFDIFRRALKQAVRQTLASNKQKHPDGEN